MATASPLDGLEARWGARWESAGTYRFDRARPRDEIYSIDTPPPTVSGSLHVGHVFSYTQTDTLARYQRMQGRAVFYPMGWDDNGLPTERRVENHFGVTCDPTVEHQEHFEPPPAPATRRQDFVKVGRRNFVELCERLTAVDEQVFEGLWRRLGLSVDWSLTYSTVSQRAQRVSQRAFLRNLARGEAYSAEAPSLWDTTYQTAVAQAELEDRERPGAYHDLRFHGAAGDVIVSTTRPELLPACVALVAHPDDERYQALFGTTVTSPVFDVEVPVRAHRLADPEKGTGIAMVCTFGDLTDVIWWRELDLPTRAVITRSGRFAPGVHHWIETDSARKAYEQIEGATTFAARESVVARLRETGDLIGEPRPITHPVKFYERGDRPLEIVTSRQWYIRNGGRSAQLRERFQRCGAELGWHPDHMRHRYQNWVEGLNGDWLVSRQRYFGVPVPVWYPLDGEGRPDHEHPIVPAEPELPIDPQSHVPPGFAPEQRDRAGGFTGDPDVLDTWATSSLTPQIACGWVDDADLFDRTFPMDLRPQGHDIIRTWLFSTVVRSEFEHGELPWAHAALSGWILDPDRKKMSKSKGNALVPTDLLDQFGADAVRYWAAGARLGIDTAFDPAQMKIGRRLALKVLNASRFAIGLGSGLAGSPPAQAVTEPVDRDLLLELASVVAGATAAFEAYEPGRALSLVEDFFWRFCDDYLELVKDRAYDRDLDQGPASGSAQATLRAAISTVLRLLAPFLPYACEEAWSWGASGDGEARLPGFEAASVHLAPWPTAELVRELAAQPAEGVAVLPVAAEVLREIRRAKSDARRSVRSGVTRVTVVDSPSRLAAVRLVEGDLRGAGNVAEVVTVEIVDGAPPRIEVLLAEAGSPSTNNL